MSLFLILNTPTQDEKVKLKTMRRWYQETLSDGCCVTSDIDFKKRDEKQRQNDNDDDDDEEEDESIDEKTEIANSSQSSSPPFRDAKKDVANLRKKVAEARKNAKSAANSPSSPNTSGIGKSTPNAQKKSEISALGERSIVKRAIEAQKRVEEAAKGLNRINESQKRLFHH